MFFANPTQKILTISRRGKRERTEITYRSTITYKIKIKKKKNPNFHFMDGNHLY